MKWIGNWAEKSVNNAWRVLLMAVLVSGLSVYAVIELMRFETDHAALVTRDAPFWGPWDEFQDEFPELRRTGLVVVESASFDTVDDVSRALKERLALETDTFETVFLGEADPFFDKHALLFLDLKDLEETVDRLAKAQPALTTVADDPSLRGFFDLVRVGRDAMDEGTDLPTSFVEIVDETTKAVSQVVQGEPVVLSWAGEMMGDDDDIYRRIIIVQPKDVATTEKNDRPAAALLKKIAAEPQYQEFGEVRIRVSGRLGMAYDEVVAIKQSVSLAGTLSLIFLTVILIMGLPSYRIIIAVFSTLIVGLCLSLGFAAVTIGSLNLVSAAFAVLFVGLGIDHALHVALRYEEYLRTDKSHLEAVRHAAETTGNAVALCALTSAIGFAAFIPTGFLGMAELGVIAAAGMGFAFVASMTVLPAILTVLNAAKHPMRIPILMPQGKALNPRRRFAATGFVFGALASVYLIQTGIDFNFSSLAMRDQNSESISTLYDLQEDNVVTDYVANIMVHQSDDTAEIVKRLEALDVVDEVQGPWDLVAEDQEIKLDMIDEAVSFLWPILMPGENKPALTDEERLAEVKSFIDEMEDLRYDPEESSQSIVRLADEFAAIMATNEPNEALQEIETEIMQRVVRQLDRLRTALEADFYTIDDVPEYIQRRFISKDGMQRISVLPSEDLTDLEALKRFVAATQEIEPTASGRPAIEEGVGGIVVDSFKTAGFIAFLSIAIILLVVFRSFRDMVYVLIPISLAGVLTIATANFFNIPFNFANVIALPLIFGLGVDAAIHLVLRARESHSAEEIASSSTPQAVLLSSLTTVAAFASLSTSAHYGMASMGITLTIGIVWLLFSTLLVLPGLLKVRGLG